MATEYPLHDAELMGRMRDGDRLPPGAGARTGSGLDAPGFTHTTPPGAGTVRDNGTGVPMPTRDGTSYADNGTEARSGVPLGAAGMDPSHVTEGMTMAIPGDYPSNGASYPNVVVEATHVSESGAHIAHGLASAANPPI